MKTFILGLPMGVIIGGGAVWYFTVGRVTLSGTVASPELIGKATALALETDGVREVVSTLQVK